MLLHALGNVPQSLLLLRSTTCKACTVTQRHTGCHTSCLQVTVFARAKVLKHVCNETGGRRHALLSGAEPAQGLTSRPGISCAGSKLPPRLKPERFSPVTVNPSSLQDTPAQGCDKPHGLGPTQLLKLLDGSVTLCFQAVRTCCAFRAPVQLLLGLHEDGRVRFAPVVQSWSAHIRQQRQSSTSSE